MDVREYDLNLIPGSVPQIIKINQYDKGISFTFTIYQGDKKFSIPSGAIVALSGTKPDGLGFHYACTFSGSTASVTIGDQVAVLSGNVRAELTITSGDSVRLGTANFTFCVEPAALKDDTAVSDSDFPGDHQSSQQYRCRTKVCRCCSQERSGCKELCVIGGQRCIESYLR